MTVLHQKDLMFTHLHLTGATWDQPSRYSFADRVAALGEHGAIGMGMNAEEFGKLLTEYSADQIKGILADHGQRIIELEVLIGWDHSDDATELEDHLIGLADTIGIEKIKASAVTPPGTEVIATDILIRRFGALCDRAGDHELTVALESIAVMPGFNYGIAADTVQGADRWNGKLQLDLWHLFRDPTGPAAVAALDGRFVSGVELCDGPAEPGEDLMAECTGGRLFPGDGAFPIVSLLHDLEAKGVDVPLSVEVLNTELRELSPSENVATSKARIEAFLATARES
ncbi:sugar phosphate isomerase/epimerase family protein [Labedaea rhizosphaerae]|uniref:Sugar phosphate isomerase/epimerase n=1 Tax=Labedaea rhizosphaerae TaxID=598644 RepID=A0A4R6SM68_LABRH|nr:sugar phosphate isomerase/epimerase [Labedaea rhizosphaerae]TDQ04412.1 sugar phosphate isomerase/epimerase [Labedaea rhizosphaerae]